MAVVPAAGGDTMAAHAKKKLHVRGYLFAGILTVVPLWVTWIVFKFVYDQLRKVGIPWVKAAAAGVSEDSVMAQWLLQPWVQDLLAALLTLIALYLLGWIVSRVLGRRVISVFEKILSRVPLVQNVYGAVKKLIITFQQSPEDVQRVVLIAFPSPEMKTIGLVTQTLTDKKTGQKLAAVYVPTTPNPTSGYLEIVPIDDLVPTEWTIDEAMSFIISGGAVAPKDIDYGPFPTKK